MMKKPIGVWCALFVFAGGCLFAAGKKNGKVDASSVNQVRTYRNHLDVTIADPFVLHEGKVYYLYGTNESNGLKVSVSRDLVNWQDKGFCYRPTRDSWGQTDFWAPEVIHRGAKYYLYFVAKRWNDKKRNICVAVSNSPLGPFRDLSGPMFPDLSVIDPHVFADPASSDVYMYVVDEHESPSRILGGKLKSDMKTLATSLTLVLKPDMEWEDYWVEAPFVIRHDGKYYMMYSGGAWWEPEYAVGYSVGPTPLGPFKKYRGNPILHRSSRVDGPGHNCVAMSPDGREMFIIYHTHIGRWSVQRMLAMDRLEFVKNVRGEDILTVPTGATSSDQPLPSGAEKRARAVSDGFDGKVPRDQWIIRNERPKAWEIADGKLTIRLLNGDYWRSQSGGKNLFFQYAPTGDFAISTTAKFDGFDSGEHAALILWDDEDNFVMFGPGDESGKKYILSNEFEQKNDSNLFPPGKNWPGPVKLELRGRDVSAFVETEEGKWKQTGKTIRIDFQPRFAGVAAWKNSDDRSTVTASFEAFHVQPLP